MLHFQPSSGQPLQGEVARLEDGLRQVYRAGDGCMTLSIVTSASAPSIITAATEGNVAAKNVLAAADRLLRQIARRSRVRAMQCSLCEANSLWRKEAPTAIGLLVPFGVECPSVAVGLAFCDACAADRPERELGMAMVTRLRNAWMPDLRIFSPMPAAGHA